MIWYAISPAKLRAAIKKVDADWFDDAAAVVAALPDPPKSSDFKPLWSRIKGVYKRVLAGGLAPLPTRRTNFEVALLFPAPKGPQQVSPGHRPGNPGTISIGKAL